MKHIFTFILCFSILLVNAQTLDELKAKKAGLVQAKAAPILAEADAIKAEIDGINKQIATFPRRGRRGW